MAAETQTFGPKGEEWTYTPSTKTYDLSRGASQKFALATTTEFRNATLEVDPKKSALVIVDMQNFFLSPRCREHPLGLAAVKPTIKVIEKCREAGIQVIWLNWGLTDKDMATMPASVTHGFASKKTSKPSGLGVDLGSGQGRCLFANTWNADIYDELKGHVQPGDVHCAKNRMSGMWSAEQPLWKELDARGLRSLFFTGVNTDQCVLGTLTNAYNAGWDCVLVEDCSATTTPNGGQVVSCHNIGNSYGFIVNSQTFAEGKLE